MIVYNINMLTKACLQRTIFHEQWYNQLRKDMKLIKDNLKERHTYKELNLLEESKDIKNPLWSFYIKNIYMTIISQKRYNINENLSLT